MTPRLTSEMRQALQSHPGEPVEILDDETQSVYLLIDREHLSKLWDEMVRRELQLGFDAIDRGEVAELDIEATIAEARRRHAESSR